MLSFATLGEMANMASGRFYLGLALAALLTGCSQPTANQPKVTAKQEAAAALAREDSSTAEQLYRPLAERGDASAQHNLGKMYLNGVPSDPVAAAKWLRLAADQGHSGAQFYLGNMYADGRGVPTDYVQAYMWLELSEQGSQEYYAARDRAVLAKKMTGKQIGEAQGLVRAWKASRSNS
jgi:TPR repeat protein